MAGISVVTASQSEPITIEELKTHLRVDIADEDTLLNSLIQAAREYCERITGRQFVSATYDQTFEKWEDNLVLSYPPLSSVTSVKYYDEDGVEQTLSSAVYDVVTNEEPGYIRLAYNQSWPTIRSQNEPITVRFVAGYGVDDDVPSVLKQAIKLLAGHLFEHREAVARLHRGETMTELPLAFGTLIWGYRMLEAC